MTRRTTAETRDLLIDVGLRLLYERGVSAGVTHVRLRDVVAAASLTTGAAYRCWANQEEFHRDLAAAAIERHQRTVVADTVAEIKDLVDARAPIPEIVRVAAAANLYRYPDHTAFLTTLAVRAGATADEAVAQAARAYLDRTVEGFAELYEALLRVYGRRMRAPYTVVHLTLALAALSEGFAIQALGCEPHPHVRRAELREGVGSDWSLFGVAAEAIVDQFTEPDPDAAKEPVPGGAAVPPAGDQDPDADGRGR